MAAWPQIPCWCEEAIPPWSVVWIKEVMNPIALQKPIAVVARPTDNLEFAAQGTMSGTFTLTYDGQTTAVIPYDASALDVQTALAALSNLGIGQVSVTKHAEDWIVEFTGTLALTDVPLMTADGSGLTGGSVEVKTLQEHRHALDETQTLTLSPGATGTFTLGFSTTNSLGQAITLLTAPIAVTATAQQVATAIATGFTFEPYTFSMVTSVQGTPGNWTVTIGDAIGGAGTFDFPLLTVGGQGTTLNGTLSVATATQAQTALNEQQIININLPGNPLGLLVKTWDPYYLGYTDALYVSNLRPEAVTNGIVSVPAKTIFQAKQLMFGAHWLGYDEAVGANPAHDWFYPRTDTWRLASVVDASLLGTDLFALRGCVFRRIGRADTIQKCVPVVMLSQDDG